MVYEFETEPVKVPDFVAESILEAQDQKHIDTTRLIISNEGLQSMSGPVPDTDEQTVHFFASLGGGIVIEDRLHVNNRNLLYGDIDAAIDGYKERVEALAGLYVENVDAKRQEGLERDPCENWDIEFDLPEELQD